MVICKQLSREDCVNTDDCIFTSGQKRKYCRKAKNTRKTRKPSTKSNQTNSSTLSLKLPKKTKKKISVRKSSSLNLLKIDNDYEALNINQGDFFIDPCMMLKKLKKNSNENIFNFTNNNLEKLEKIIPIFNPIPGKSNHFSFGKDKLILKKQINSGAYGEIYNAEINKKKVILKIPKSKHFTFEDFFLETFIQNELFCDLRGSFGQGARIPKIEFFGKMKVGNKTVGIIAIEPLDMDGHGFMKLMKNDRESNKHCMDMVVQISQLLTKLQEEYKFMHKDFHSGNIMCNKVGNQYRWYIIDFGMASIKLDGKWIHGKTDFPYNGPHTLNKSHDLRMLFCSLFYNLVKTLREDNGYQKCPIIFLRMLVKYMRPISKYLKTPESTLFWNTYGDVVHMVDKNLIAENVYEVFSLAKVNMNTIMDYIYSDMTSLVSNYNQKVQRSNLIRYLDEICQYLA